MEIAFFNDKSIYCATQKLELCLIASLSLVTSVNAFGSLKSNIQKELDANPYLKKEGVKLRVTEVIDGYVTVEMYAGNRKIREKINRGLDILTSNEASIDFGNAKERITMRKTMNALRSAIGYVQKMEDVRDVMLIAALNTDQDRGEDLFDHTIDMYQKEQYNQVVNLLKESAALGYVKSQSQLAYMYEEGKGVKKGNRSQGAFHAARLIHCRSGS